MQQACQAGVARSAAWAYAHAPREVATPPQRRHNILRLLPSPWQPRGARCSCHRRCAPLDCSACIGAPSVKLSDIVHLGFRVNELDQVDVCTIEWVHLTGVFLNPKANSQDHALLLLLLRTGQLSSRVIHVYCACSKHMIRQVVLYKA